MTEHREWVGSYAHGKVERHSRLSLAAERSQHGRGKLVLLFLSIAAPVALFYTGSRLFEVMHHSNLPADTKTILSAIIVSAIFFSPLVFWNLIYLLERYSIRLEKVPVWVETRTHVEMRLSLHSSSSGLAISWTPDPSSEPCVLSKQLYGTLPPNHNKSDPLAVGGYLSLEDHQASLQVTRHPFRESIAHITIHSRKSDRRLTLEMSTKGWLSQREHRALPPLQQRGIVLDDDQRDAFLDHARPLLSSLDLALPAVLKTAVVQSQPHMETVSS